ncbi:uncharacterized protein LOC109824500 isoform X2 [Asparagus officinalis]|nr:uncharacterized protein LOC109824500 isoform X2 [Asparagus officinalis]
MILYICVLPDMAIRYLVNVPRYIPDFCYSTWISAIRHEPDIRHLKPWCYQSQQYSNCMILYKCINVTPSQVSVELKKPHKAITNKLRRALYFRAYLSDRFSIGFCSSLLLS